MFERINTLIGQDNLDKIKNTQVLVVGIGGVGGYAVESLIRSGVENIILIDHDNIDITNLNRQIISLNSNIGMPKVTIMNERIKDINPNCNITTHKIFLDETNINQLNNYKIDYIIDACDSTNTKKLLIDYSIEKDIKLISCMGTANKLDPTKLQITDLTKTSYDPLAKILRKYLKEKKINKKIIVVSSTEEPIKTSSLSSMIFVPASAGILCANYIIKDILKNNIYL